MKSHLPVGEGSWKAESRPLSTRDKDDLFGVPRCLLQLKAFKMFPRPGGEGMLRRVPSSGDVYPSRASTSLLHLGLVFYSGSSPSFARRLQVRTVRCRWSWETKLGFVLCSSWHAALVSAHSAMFLFSLVTGQLLPGSYTIWQGFSPVERGVCHCDVSWYLYFRGSFVLTMPVIPISTCQLLSRDLTHATTFSDLSFCQNIRALGFPHPPLCSLVFKKLIYAYVPPPIAIYWM